MAVADLAPGGPCPFLGQEAWVSALDYLLAGPRVLLAGLAGPLQSAELPGGAAGGPDTRELVLTGSLLVVIDGDAGRLDGLDADSLQLRFRQRLYSADPVVRLRATLAGPDRLILVAAERAAGAATPTQLVATALPLDGRSGPLPTRILLGSGPPASDHELVPVAASDGGGALLLRTHAGNTGPLVALTHLHL